MVKHPITGEPDFDFEKGGYDFNYTFDKDTYLCGYMKLRLYIECRGYDNMDMFIRVRKYGVNGQYLPVNCMGEPFVGTWGEARGARRELDAKLSTDYSPVQAHQKDEPMEQGQVYPIDIEILPTSRVWHKGETLNIHISPEFMVNIWYEDIRMTFVTDNGEPGQAKHVLHTGGQYESFLQIPVIPPKYTAGDYVYLK